MKNHRADWQSGKQDSGTPENFFSNVCNELTTRKPTSVITGSYNDAFPRLCVVGMTPS